MRYDLVLSDQNSFKIDNDIWFKKIIDLTS